MPLSRSAEDDRRDVVVLGGGPAGSTAALALRRLTDLRVCLIDPDPPDGRIVGESIPPDTRLHLEQLGVWDRFLADKHEPCLGSCAAWGHDRLGYNDFLLNPHGPGWHLDRARFNRMLRTAAVDAGTDLVDARFAGPATRTEHGHQLRLIGAGVSPRTLVAPYVIDATGRAAAYARVMGAHRVVLDQFTVICGFFEQTSNIAANSLTLLESQPDGWWYTAAVPGRQVIAAFATDPDTARTQTLREPHHWVARCRTTDHVAKRLATCRFVPGSLTFRTASSSVLRPAAGPGWYAIGDARAEYDPLTAHGLHKAITDGIRAAEAIASARTSPDPETAYDQDGAASFAAYTHTRNHLYSLENRWPHSVFWQKRRLIHNRPTDLSRSPIAVE